MCLKLVIICVIFWIETIDGENTKDSSKSKRGLLTGIYDNLYHYVDSLPISSEFYNPIYIPSIHRYREPKIVNQPQTQESAYTQYLNAPNPARYLPSQAETVATPVQHSAFIHHAPYYPIIQSTSPPILSPARVPHVNGKYMQAQHPLQHPLQKPLHYQQQPFVPSPQYIPNANVYNSQHHRGFIPVKGPAQISQQVHHPQSQKRPPPPQEEVNEESAEEDEGVVEDKEQINEEDEVEEEDEEERPRRPEPYREDDSGEEEVEEPPPKYVNYSSDKRNKKRPVDDEEEEEEEERGHAGYRTHEDVDEGEEDTSEESSSLSYRKKTPKNYSKFEKKPPINKSRPIKSNYERYTFTRGRDGRPKIDGIQGKPSETVPVTVQKIFKEKWYITREDTQ